MRTTIRIDDALYRELKATAARQGRTIGQVIEDAVRAQARRHAAREEVQALPVHRGGRGVLPGVDLASSAALREVMDQGAQSDALR